MTNEQAIKILDGIEEVHGVLPEDGNEVEEALNMAIKALEQEPCEDAISRSGAIKAIEERAKRIKNEDTLNGLAGAVGILFELPSVKPKDCDTCEVGNPCLYCEHDFKAQADRNEFYNWDAPIRHKADGEYISRKALLEDLYKRDYTKFTHRDFVALVQYQDIVAIPPEHDGCKDCVYQANPQDAMPCRECKQNYMDKWKARPKEEPRYCDRNICLRNEYNGIGCDECEVGNPCLYCKHEFEPQERSEE